MKLIELSSILLITISCTNAANLNSIINNDVADDNVFKLSNFHLFYDNLVSESRLLSQQSYNVKAGSETGSVKLEWQTCDSRNDVIVPQNIVLDPNPFNMPGQLSLSLDVQVSQDLFAPIAVQTVMEKEMRIFGFPTWITVPCYDNVVGSCVIENICNLINISSCPLQKEGQPVSCSCPILQGSYQLPPLQIQVPELPSIISSSLLEGKYRIKGILSKDQVDLGCFQATADISFS